MRLVREARKPGGVTCTARRGLCEPQPPIIETLGSMRALPAGRSCWGADPRSDSADAKHTRLQGGKRLRSKIQRSEDDGALFSSRSAFDMNWEATAASTGP